MPLVSRTRATLRSAEFGFFGVVVYTRVQTPRRCGAATFFLRPLPDFRPGVASFFFGGTRPLRISWLVVGMRSRRVAGAARTPRPPRARFWITGRQRAVDVRITGPAGEAWRSHLRASAPIRNWLRPQLTPRGSCVGR